MRYKQKAILLLAVATPIWPPAFVPNAAPPSAVPAATFSARASIAAPPATVPNAVFKPGPTPCERGLCPVPTFTIQPLPCDFFPSLVCPRPADGVYLILGDSLALGLYGTPGYAAIFEDYLENASGIELDSRNLARSGWHSSHLAAALQHDPLLRQQVAVADIITWNIGGNDLRAARDLYHRGECGGTDNEQCLRRVVTAFRNNWSVIVGELQTLRKSSAVPVVTMDLYNPFVKEDMARGTFKILDPYFDQVNTYITTSLKTAGVPFARISSVFNGPNGLEDPADMGFISFDGYHPNSAGHRVIADQLLRLDIPLPSKSRTRPSFSPLVTFTPIPLPTTRVILPIPPPPFLPCTGTCPR